MRFIAVIFAIAPVLTACTDALQPRTPAVDERKFYFAADILHTLECELSEATMFAKNVDDRFSRQAVAVTLTLQVKEVRTADGLSKLVLSPANSVLSLSPFYTPVGTGTRTMDLQHGYSTSELEDCNRNRSRYNKALGGQLYAPTRIPGGLGLTEWVRQLATLMVTVGEDPKSASYTVEFSVDETLGIEPELASGSNKILKLTTSRKKSSLHKIAVTVQEMTKAEARSRESRDAAIERVFRAQELFLQRLND